MITEHADKKLEKLPLCSGRRVSPFTLEVEVEDHTTVKQKSYVYISALCTFVNRLEATKTEYWVSTARPFGAAEENPKLQFSSRWVIPSLKTSGEDPIVRQRTWNKCINNTSWAARRMTWTDETSLNSGRTAHIVSVHHKRIYRLFSWWRYDRHFLF